MSDKCTCGAEVIWKKTLGKRDIPLDVDLMERRFILLDGDMTIDIEVYPNHLDICPELEPHRRKDDWRTGQRKGYKCRTK